MAFNFEDMLIDRPLDIVFRNAEGKVLGGINQISNFSINKSSETKDKTDSQGVLIKRFFTSTSVEVSGENALVSLSLMALQAGGEKKVGSSDDKITLPIIMKVAKTASPVTLAHTPVGAISVTGLTAAGVPDAKKAYSLAEAAGAGVYAKAESEGHTVITLPTDAADYVQIVYYYEAESAVEVTVAGNKFPNTCEMLCSVLVCDACNKEVLRHAYISFPSFQLSPDFDWTIDTSEAQKFSGVGMLDYCSADKTLFKVTLSEDDIEE